MKLSGYQKVQYNWIAAETCRKTSKLNIPSAMTENNHPQSLSRLESLLHWGLVSSCLIAPFIFIPGTYTTVKIPQMAFIQLAALFLFTVWLLKNISHQTVIRRSPLYGPVILLLLWSLGLIIFAANRQEGFTVWRHDVGTAIFFFLILQDCRSARRRIHYFAALYIAACGMALLGICQHLFNLGWIPQAVPPAAMFVNRNLAAHFMVLTLPLGLFFLLSNTNKRLHQPLFFFSALMVVFVVYTGSRAAWLAITMQFFLFIFLWQKHGTLKGQYPFYNKSKRIPAVMAITIILLLINLGPKGFEWNMGKLTDRAVSITRISEKQSDRESLTSAGLRLAFWANTTAMIKDNLLTGVGPGNFRIIYPLYSQRIVRDPVFNYNTQLHRTHNDFLQAFAELGLIGILILLWFAVELMRIVRRIFTKSTSAHDLLMTTTVVTIMAGIGINACFSFPFQRPIPPLVFMVMVGIIGSIDSGATRPFYCFSPSTRTTLLATSISLLLLLLAGRFHQHSLQFDRLAFQMAISESNQQWDDLIDQGRTAFSRYPGQVSYLSPLGKAFIGKKMYREAAQVLTSSIKYYPNSINDNMNLGMALTNTGDFDRARKAYNKILTINPYLGKTHFNIGLLLEKQGRWNDALQEYIRAKDLEPDNSITLISIGKIQAQQGDYESAARSFSKALEIDKNSATAHKNLGILYHQFLNQPEKARMHLGRALELQPDIYGAEQIRTLLQNH